MPFPFVPVLAGAGFVWGLWKLFSGPSSTNPDPGPGPGPEPAPGPIGTGETYADGYSAGQADALAANITTAFDTSPDYASLKVHFDASKPAAWKQGYNDGWNSAITKSSSGGGGGGGSKDVTGTVAAPPGSTYADGAKVGEADGVVAKATAAFDTSPDWEHMMVHYDGTKSSDWKKGYLDAYNAAVA